MDTATRTTVWERAHGKCEITGQPLGPPDSDRWECHHRRNKGMGGTSRADRDALSNLLALTPLIHNGGPQSVHGRREWAEENGYLVPKHVHQAKLWPVRLRGRHWVILGDDGRYYPLPPGLEIR